MAKKLDDKAIEGGTYAITLTFTDDDGNAVSPITLSWALSDLNSNIINDREDVSVSSPSSTETIVLSGDDLKITDRSAKERILTVSGTYDSDLGSGLPIRDSVIFIIEDFFEPAEVWEDQIILLSEVRSILQIASTDTSMDNSIETLIPIIQEFVIEYTENNFEKKGVCSPDRTGISFENDDPPYIEDNGSDFLEFRFDDYINDVSVTSTAIAFVDNGTGEDQITLTGSGFIAADFKEGNKISVLDSDSNDGVYTIRSISSSGGVETINVPTGSLATEAAGESITITTGIDVRVEGSRRNDGLYNVKKVEGSKLTLRDDERLKEEFSGNLIDLTVIIGKDFPTGIKLPVAKLIGYQLNKKGKGVKKESIGDYSVEYDRDYPQALLRELDPWMDNDLCLATTYDDTVDENYLDTGWPLVIDNE